MPIFINQKKIFFETLDTFFLNLIFSFGKKNSNKRKLAKALGSLVDNYQKIIKLNKIKIMVEDAVEKQNRQNNNHSKSSQISNSLNRIVLSPSVDEFKRINNTTHFIRRIALEELID